MASVLLTGASAGIGRATALALLERGFAVWGTSRDASRLADLPGLHPVEMNLCEPASIASGFAAAAREAGEFDVLINNAGDGVFGPFEHLPLSEVRRQFETLVFGHLDLIQRVLPAMRKRGSGRIINVTSLAAQLPIPLMAPYNAAKAAMSAFSASLNLELAGTGVFVIDLQPGDIRTGFNRSVFRGPQQGYEDFAEEMWDAIEATMAEAPPPEIVARTILRLLEKPVSRAIAGDFFQARLAPLLARAMPRSWLLLSIRRYFEIAAHGLRSSRRKRQ